MEWDEICALRPGDQVSFRSPHQRFQTSEFPPVEAEVMKVDCERVELKFGDGSRVELKFGDGSSGSYGLQLMKGCFLREPALPPRWSRDEIVRMFT